MSTRHETYKHLEARIKIGSFTVGQFIIASMGLLLAAVFGFYVSPLPGKWTFGISLFLGLLPAAIARGTSGAEGSASQTLRAMSQWMREPKHYLPGASEVMGYVVEPVVVDEGRGLARSTEDVSLAKRNVEGAWDG